MKAVMSRDALFMGQTPYLLAVLNNTVWGLFARSGATNLTQARREFSYQIDKALHAQASYKGILTLQHLCRPEFRDFTPSQYL